NNEVDRNQREFILREQLKAIKEELGEDEEEDEWEAEVENIRKQIKKAKMPREIEKVALKELERLAEMPPVAAEYTISRTYIDWLVSLPWGKETKDNMDISYAIRILDEDHYDLKDVKDRILEFLAVHKLKKQTKGPILCFAGPPGVGKTSLGKSIARAMGRKFVRYSVGGIHDEAEIRGHRRTYIGALPGRIIQMIKEAGTRNPVFMLDEIDKLGTDFRGDPASALLEALDPQQNDNFVDHYLDVKFDLSRVMFITTCNVLYNIPPALLDRMEVIEIPGYISEEKVQIARKYLVPRQIEENGLKKSYLKFRIDAIERIILDYTHEAGVRNLEREIANICRKVARRFAEGDRTPVTISAEDVPKYLGPPKNFPELAGIKDEIGIATGLAWTPVGGEILFIESTAMKGGKHLTLTGQLGEVMRESAQAALSYIRTHAEKYNIDPDFFKNNDIHIHVPSGAVAKDGPSAGVTIATSLLSLLTRQPVRHDVAMTGEITLRGRILPVGGIKEKVLAAKRSGISAVVLPKRNEKDLIEVPENIRKKMKFVFVEKLSEAFAFALRGTSDAVSKNKRAVKRKTVIRAGKRSVAKIERKA
ncbi:MAG TPA: endopeptidase La, partial [Caldithrix sp.]|nr:endopeptidase La [Caldithrix sp.]